jgi:hypothetical protein
MLFKRELIQGHKIEFHVGVDGDFVAKEDGSMLARSESFDEVREKVSAVLRREKKAACIRLRFFDTDLMKHREIGGLHASNGNALVRTDGEKGSEQRGWYQFQRVLRPLSKNEEEQRQDLRDAVAEAQKLLDDFDAPRKLPGTMREEYEKLLGEKLDA